MQFLKIAIERVQKNCTWMLHGKEGCSSKERLDSLALFCPECRRLQGDLYRTFSLLLSEVESRSREFMMSGETFAGDLKRKFFHTGGGNHLVGE